LSWRLQAPPYPIAAYPFIVFPIMQALFTIIVFSGTLPPHRLESQG